MEREKNIEKIKKLTTYQVVKEAIVSQIVRGEL
jgi:hypothetical protein